MDQPIMTGVPFYPYDQSIAYPQYTIPNMYAMAPMPFPVTPTTSGMHMFPADTTVKSGSEFGDTPPSSGSSQSKKKFESAEAEKRYRTKRARNNEAAKKSRKSRKEKEMTLADQNQRLVAEIKDLRHRCAVLEHDNARLTAVVTSFQSGFNNENINPAIDSKPFQGMFGSMNMNSQ